MFVELHNGVDGWPERDTGLPKVRVNGIAVDPNNSSVAYVMFGGGAGVGHVWKTTNGGQTWANVTNNLPDVPAYSMVIDGCNFPNAPQGYRDFDQGAARKYVIDPHGQIER